VKLNKRCPNPNARVASLWSNALPEANRHKTLGMVMKDQLAALVYSTALHEALLQCYSNFGPWRLKKCRQEIGG